MIATDNDIAADIDADIGAPVEARMLDPFSFVPDYGSAVGGLYGEAGMPDPLYIFHTPYADGFSGLNVVDMQFTDLRSRKDRMTVTVHGLNRATERLEIIASIDVSLRTVAASGGKATISFDGQPGYLYAVIGRSITPPEATAARLTVTCRTSPGSTTVSAETPEAVRYRPEGLRNVTTLLANRPTTFTAPMSQACTAAHAGEAAFRHWRDVAGLEGLSLESAWECAFPLQSLRYFGVFDTPGRGVGFGRNYDRMASVLRSAGLATDAASALAAPAEDSAPNPNGIGGYAHLVSLPEPSFLRQFDFLWSMGMCERLTNSMDMIYFIEDTLEYLRPGGMAVHMLAASIGCDDAVDRPAAAFSRNALAQLALAVVGGRNELAQMNMFVDANDRGIKTYGVIIRKE